MSLDAIFNGLRAQMTFRIDMVNFTQIFTDILNKNAFNIMSNLSDTTFYYIPECHNCR